MATPSSLAHTLHLIHHINDETIVYLDLAKRINMNKTYLHDSIGPTQKYLTLTSLAKLYTSSFVVQSSE